MPLYFFDVHDGRPTRDLDGTELIDLGAARTEAIRLAGSIIRDGAADFSGPDWRFSVRGVSGEALFAFTFSAAAPLHAA